MTNSMGSLDWKKDVSVIKLEVDPGATEVSVTVQSTWSPSATIALVDVRNDTARVLKHQPFQVATPIRAALRPVSSLRPLLAGLLEAVPPLRTVQPGLFLVVAPGTHEEEALKAITLARRGTQHAGKLPIGTRIDATDVVMASPIADLVVSLRGPWQIPSIGPDGCYGPVLVSNDKTGLTLVATWDTSLVNGERSRLGPLLVRRGRTSVVTAPDWSTLELTPYRFGLVDLTPLIGQEGDIEVSYVWGEGIYALNFKEPSLEGTTPLELTLATPADMVAIPLDPKDAPTAGGGGSTSGQSGESARVKMQARVEIEWAGATASIRAVQKLSDG